jgi:hypothetical protein
MSDSIKELLHCAEEMFGQVLHDVEPYNEPEQLPHLLFFRRFTEWQYAYCRAIRVKNCVASGPHRSDESSCTRDLNLAGWKGRSDQEWTANRSLPNAY